MNCPMEPVHVAGPTLLRKEGMDLDDLALAVESLHEAICWEAS